MNLIILIKKHSGQFTQTNIQMAWVSGIFFFLLTFYSSKNSEKKVLQFTLNISITAVFNTDNNNKQ